MSFKTGSNKEDEAAKAGIVSHHHFMRIGDMESNLAPPSSDRNRWFEKVSVLIPNGESVGAIKPWEWPDAFQNVTTQHAVMVRSLIDQRDEPPRADIRSADWVGEIICKVIGLNPSVASDKSKAKNIASTWIKTDVLRVVEHYNSRAARNQKVVICGGNNPISEA